jgi:hypothetical protein
MAIGSEILEWSKDRPVWQRDALRRLFTYGELSANDVAELLSICKAVHGLCNPVEAQPLVTADIVAHAGMADRVILSSITHHQGVNALAPEQNVKFGSALTVVYGQNAAGKSGYTRILKRACRSRSFEKILGNVLSGEAPAKPRATIKFRQGSAELAFEWSHEASPPVALAAVSVFDAQCAPVYLRDKTDVAFRPFGLDIFDKLSVACTQIRAELESERAKLSMTAVALPAFSAGTAVRKLADGLSSLTKPATVQSLANLTDTERTRLKALQDQRRDLQASDPKKLARDLDLRADRIDGLVLYVSGLSDLFSEPNIGELRDLSTCLRSARDAFAAVQSSAIAPDLLEGTGADEWKRMWKAAADFSRRAYPGSDFPVIEPGALCLFCQQPIGDDAAARLRHLAEYVRSNVLQQVDITAAAVDIALKPLRAIAIDRDDIKLTVSEIASDDETLANTISAFMRAAADMQARLSETDSGAVAEIGLAIFETIALREKAASFRARAGELRKEAPAMSAEAAAELAELEARELLGRNVQVVLSEIERKQRLAAYSQCIEDTATHAITRKSTELTKELITDGLRQTFHDELVKLEFTHLAVEIQSAGGTKGALFHRLVFSDAPNASVADVLSEGEARTLSLAAFLTELQTAPVKSAIIFDDPVSSLDHMWRERIARRLVTEAKDRQVIVFTHDLLFLRYLMNDSDGQDVACTHQYVQRDGAAGIASPDLPFIAMGVNQRIGVLRNRWQALDKLSRTGGATAYESAAREMYRLVRQTWEQAVSEVLLNDVVQRYRPSIETQRVRHLHDITQTDRDTVETEMGECSRWLHDEAAADATPIPGPQALKDRIDKLDLWVYEIRKRRHK